MSIILPYIYISLVTLFLVMLFNKKYEICLPIAFLVSTLFSYIGGMIGNVKIGYYICIAISLLTIPFLIYKRDKFKIIIKNYFTLGFVIFLILYLLMVIYHRYTAFSYWDEFMHWGPMVSETNRLNAFYTVNESTLMIHKDYPPFAALLENLWCNFAGSFEENYCFRALNAFSLALIMPLLCNYDFKIKDILKSVSIIIIFVSINIFNYVEFRTFFDTIYTDFLLGLFGVYCIYLSLELVKKRELFNYINLSLSLSSLLLIKQMGIAFYMLSIFVIVIGFIINKIDIRTNIVKIIMFLFMIPLLFIGSWKIFVSHFSDIFVQFSVSDFSVQEFINIFFYGIGEEWQIRTLANFKTAIISKNLISIGNFGLSFVELVILLLLIMFVISYLSKDKRSYIILLTFAIGSLGYLFAMLLLYLFSFDSYEGPLLASFERYFNTYIYFGFLLLMIMIQYIAKKQNLTAFILVLICLVFVNSNFNMLKPRSFDESYKSDDKYIRVFEEVGYNTKKGSKILIVSQFQDDLVWKLRYQYVDRYFDVISLGKSKYNSDIDSEEYTIAEWKQLLKKYDYIYLYNTDNEFYLDYWKQVTDIPLWNEYMYKYDNNNMCIVVDQGKCAITQE